MWKNIIFKSLLLFILPFSLSAQSYPEVIFDNSTLTGNYAKSIVHYEGRSWVENVNKHLPVSDTLFFTAGNSLSLKYLSSDLGSWSVDLVHNKQQFNYKVSNTSILNLKIYVESTFTKAADLPQLIVVQDNQESVAIDMGKYIDGFATNMWMEVKIPVKNIAQIRPGSPVTAIRFKDAAKSNQVHQLFVDQVEFLPSNHSRVKLSSAAILSKVESLDRQVELSWLLPLTPSIRYIKVYRSTDKVNFHPVHIFPTTLQKAFDKVPDIGQTYYYKIAWVDYDYLESPFSEVKEVKPNYMSDLELLGLIQKTHANYFIDFFDVNSGMFLPTKNQENPIVSVKETGYAILSLIVAAENNFISRPILLNRMSRILKFLKKAEHYEGVFPAYFDGRKGNAFYMDQVKTYDLTATSALMESLLVSRQYFFKDEPEEIALREAITELWERVNWTAFSENQQNEVLFKSISPEEIQKEGPKLYGVNESLNTYLLGLASPSHPLLDSAFYSGYATVQQQADSTVQGFDIEDAIGNSYEFLNSLNSSAVSVIDTLSHSFAIDTLVYGKRLTMPVLDKPLIDTYRVFMTLNPHQKNDGLFDYEQELKNLIDIHKNRDNELFAESGSLDIWGVQNAGSSEGQNLLIPAHSISAIAFQRHYGIQALKKLYALYGNQIFTEYGFRTWLDIHNNDISNQFKALNQASIAVMIENAKSGLIWKLYQEDPDIAPVLKKFFSTQKSN